MTSQPDSIVPMRALPDPPEPDAPEDPHPDHVDQDGALP